jgi:hypothetical protein
MKNWQGDDGVLYELLVIELANDSITTAAFAFVRAQIYAYRHPSLRHYDWIEDK